MDTVTSRKKHRAKTQSQDTYFNRFCHEEGFLLVSRLLILALYGTQCTIPISCAAILFNGLENFPSPLPENRISCQLIENKERFHSFRTQEVVGSSRSNSEILSVSKLHKFGGNTSFHACVHLVASVGQCL